MISRKSIDPVYVAEKVRANKSDLESEAARIYSTNETARDLFPSEEIYVSKVREAYDNYGKEIIIGQSIEEVPLEWIPYDRTPVYDLDSLAQEVISEMLADRLMGSPAINGLTKLIRDFSEGISWNRM